MCTNELIVIYLLGFFFFFVGKNPYYRSFDLCFALIVIENYQSP